MLLSSHKYWISFLVSLCFPEGAPFRPKQVLYMLIRAGLSEERQLPSDVAQRGNPIRALRRTPGPPTLTSGVICNPIRDTVSMVGK